MVLNEKKYAIKMLKTNEITESISISLYILAKYYFSLNKLPEENIELLNDFMSKKYVDFNRVSWNKMIVATVKKAAAKKLIEINYIPITRNELSIINDIAFEQDKRIAFTLLCFAKYNNLINPNNNNWVNTDAKDIFKSAHVIKKVTEQYKMLHRLYQNGYINLSKKISTLNKQVLFVDCENSEVILKISDFRDLGYEYLLYQGYNFTRCKSCGRLIKNNINKTKIYCSNCNKAETVKTKLNICVTCGKEYLASSKDNKSQKCDECYIIDRRKYKAEKERHRREHLRGQSK